MLASCLAAGDLAGLWIGGVRGGRGSVPGEAALFVALGVVAIGWGLGKLRRLARGRDPGRGSAAPIGAAAALAFLLGVGLGARAGGAAASACVAALRGGESAVLRGLLLDPVPGAGRGPGSATVRVRSALLVAEGRRCRLPLLRARVRRAGARIAAGRRALIIGTWRSYPRGRLRAAPLERYGAIVGSVEVSEEAGRGTEDAWARLAARLRDRGGRKLGRLVAPSVAPTARALTLADRTTLSFEVRSRFADAGLVHLLAISGLHIGMIASGLVWLLGLRWRGSGRWLGAALATAAYVGAIGAPPSAVRAAALFGGYALARARGAPARLGDLAGLAAGAAIVARPLVLLDAGFQLSFAGFFGVVAGARGSRGLARRLSSRPRASPGASRLARAARATIIGLGASAAAFLCTAPIAAAHFGRIVPAAVLSSAPGSLVVGLALPALAAALVLPEPLAAPAGAAASGALLLLHAVVDRFAALPLHWQAPALDGVGWMALGLAGAAVGALSSRRLALATLLGAAGAALPIGAPAWRSLRDAGRTLVCSLDVGQGDAALVRTRAGRWILIDAGPGRGFASAAGAGAFRAGSRSGDAGRSTIVPFLRRRGVRVIELFVLSHPHLDHFGGAAAVLDAFHVRRVLDPGFPEPSGAYLAFLDRVGEERARWLPGRAGARLRLDEIGLHLLWPSHTGPAGDANEASLAFVLEAPGLRYLNTGDAPASVEESLLERWGGTAIRADILKLGHHGSRTSSALRWLRAVRPTVAIVSAGRGNRHGHPHDVTLARVDSARIPRLWRTDREGTLCVTADEGGWRIVDP